MSELRDHLRTINEAVVSHCEGHKSCAENRDALHKAVADGVAILGQALRNNPSGTGTLGLLTKAVTAYKSSAIAADQAHDSFHDALKLTLARLAQLAGESYPPTSTLQETNLAASGLRSYDDLDTVSPGSLTEEVSPDRLETAVAEAKKMHGGLGLTAQETAVLTKVLAKTMEVGNLLRKRATSTNRNATATPFGKGWRPRVAPLNKVWSDEARAAALEARRAKGTFGPPHERTSGGTKETTYYARSSDAENPHNVRVTEHADGTHSVSHLNGDTQRRFQLADHATDKEDTARQLAEHFGIKHKFGN